MVIISATTKFVRFLAIFVALLISAYGQSLLAAQELTNISESKSILDFPVIDYPYNHSDGYTFPSMSQSLNITKSMHQYTHHYFENTDWSRAKKRLSIIGFDFLVTYFPTGDAWLHEEWHRAVMGQYGIDSYNEVYDIPLFSETISVSNVKDEDLIKLKQEHPADMVRLHAAGIESQYELGLALEKDQFYYHSITWDLPLLWFNYANNIGYMFTCASNESNIITEEILNSENQNISERDFTGLDCDAWVYDLFRPNEPYAARGTHPSGVGINRYISYSRLSEPEKKYLKRQAKLSLLNLIDPFLFGKKHFQGFGDQFFKSWQWNSSLRHHLTPFGYNVGINVFAMSDDLKLFATLNYFANNSKQFAGLDFSLLRQPMRVSNIQLHTTLRAALWQQPKDLSFYETKGDLGGMVSVKTYVGFSENSEIYLTLSRKSNGWVPGEVELNGETSIKLGFSYLLK